MAGKDAAAAAKQAFVTLHPLCSRLLDPPLTDSSLLSSLRDVLAVIPPRGLLTCFEYVLFPLQLLLNASVSCRGKRAFLPQSDSATTNEPKLYVSDKMAEGVLVCLEELLCRCPLASTSQMDVLLRKLTAAAMLSADEASEEIRHGAVKCLKALIKGLRQCDMSSCSCKSTSLPDHIVLGDDGLRPDLLCVQESQSRQEPGGTVNVYDECLIEFLQSENMSPAIGNLLSVLLQISESEALRGGIGSTKLRVDALKTVRLLLVKVRNADALAFFLPGTATRLVKSVQSSKKMSAGVSELSYPRGAAGSPLAVENAIRVLTDLIVLVLADEQNVTALHGKISTKSIIETPTEDSSGNGALSMLLMVRDEIKRSDNKHTLHSQLNGGHSQTIKREYGRVTNVTTENKGFEKLRVERNEMWLEYTVEKVTALLSLCYPALCRHPSSSVRLAVTEGVGMLMLTCELTLESFMPTFLECLLAMTCDEWPHVASVAHALLYSLTIKQPASVSISRDITNDIKQVIHRLIDKLPKSLFSADESVTIFHCRQLLSAMYFAGPGGVAECIFQSPATMAQFLKVMFQCFSFSAISLGSLKQLCISEYKFPGFVSGISELSTGDVARKAETQELIIDSPDTMSHYSSNQSCLQQNNVIENLKSPELPKMPPWFSQTIGCKIYCEIAGILRLSGLSSVLCNTRHIHMFIEELLVPFRHSPDVHAEEYRNMIEVEQWQRTVATTTALLNEVIYGASGFWFDSASALKILAFLQTDSSKVHLNHSSMAPTWKQWECLIHSMPSKQLSEIVGEILHEFMSDAIWKLPFSTDLDAFYATKNISQSYKTILRDSASLQQIIIEGIGVLALSIRNLFEEQGFLGSSLYLLLEMLGCPDFSLSNAADTSLHVISSACGYASVRHMILASTDYIIDSLCRLLRHLDLHPNAPNMLVAALRYMGTSHELFPLLKEPMHNVALELQIFSRQSRPGNTLPMLRALKEIVNISKSEGSRMLQKVSRSCINQETVQQKICEGFDQAISELREIGRLRESIQETVIMCVDSSAPLMASKDERKCLLALEIVEAGMAALSCMESVAKQEKETKNLIEELGHKCDIPDLDEGYKPKLLPTMNRVWPHLVACLNFTSPTAMIQALKVIAKVAVSCGGEFFTRRFQNDATPMMLTLLCEGSKMQSNSRSQLKKLLPYQDKNLAVHQELALASTLKVQRAVLSCIYEIASNGNSAPALQSSLEQLAAIIVALACGDPTLRDFAGKALHALCNLDADLVWILIADIAYSSDETRNISSPGVSLPSTTELLPPLDTCEEALWKQVCSKDLKITVDSSQARTLLMEMDGQSKLR